MHFFPVEDEIELKAQICENSMEQTEAEVKSEEKSGDREDEMELRAKFVKTSWNTMNQKWNVKRRVVAGKMK